MTVKSGLLNTYPSRFLKVSITCGPYLLSMKPECYPVSEGKLLIGKHLPDLRCLPTINFDGQGCYTIIKVSEGDVLAGKLLVDGP